MAAIRAVLQVQGLCLERDHRPVVNGVTFQAGRGERVALMGPSGAGKTTVLRAIAGLESQVAGAVSICRPDTDARGAEDDPGVSRPTPPIGMVFQFHHLFEHLTAIDNVCLAPVHVQGIARTDAQLRGTQLLEDLGVGARGGALPRELSGGEAQRVAIARALALDPPLLLLDEPTASLDPARRDDLGSTLRQLADSGRALLVTCHDDDFVRDYATAVVILADGCVAEIGDPKEVLTNPTHEATRALLHAKKRTT